LSDHRRNKTRLDLVAGGKAAETGVEVGAGVAIAIQIEKSLRATTQWLSERKTHDYQTCKEREYGPYDISALKGMRVHD
jgi:hypothetical protein